MRRATLSLVLLLLVAPVLSATERTPDARISITESPVAPAAPAASMHLEEISIVERTANDDAAAAQLGPRGGFWWMVGVIVVAAVILAVLL